jgi:hypothetical protein
MMTFTDLASVASDPAAPFTDRLGPAVAAYLARFTGTPSPWQHRRTRPCQNRLSIRQVELLVLRAAADPFARGRAQGRLLPIAQTAGQPGYHLLLDQPDERAPMVKLVVSSAVESPPAKTSIVVASITQSLAAAFQ